MLMKNRIVIGSDHAGYELKQHLKQWLEQRQWQVQDAGTDSSDSVDYPDFAHEVAKRVGEEQLPGVLICGSANGVCMAANKHSGIRAAIAWLPEIATLAREHNDANILCIPARFVSQEQAAEILDAYLKAEFEGGRHQRRVNKIPAQEQ